MRGFLPLHYHDRKQNKPKNVKNITHIYTNVVARIVIMYNKTTVKKRKSGRAAERNNQAIPPKPARWAVSMPNERAAAFHILASGVS